MVRQRAKRVLKRDCVPEVDELFVHHCEAGLQNEEHEAACEHQRYHEAKTTTHISTKQEVGGRYHG